jgi:DNA-binding transcriptional LysR family regulator
VVCTSDSLSGIYAAAQAGLGVAPHSGLLVPPGLSSLAASKHLPELSEIEFVVIGPKAREEIADAVVDVILRSNPVKQQFAVVASE